MTRKNGMAAGGEISGDAVYPIADFMRRTGLGETSMRQARRDGLKVRRYGGRAYLLGSDWIAFLQRVESDAPGPRPNSDSQGGE